MELGLNLYKPPTNYLIMIQPDFVHVRVYFNLHKKKLSVQTKQPKGWRVLTHLDSISLTNVEFKVYQAGRLRVLKEGKKNVHAYVEGVCHLNGLSHNWDLIAETNLVSYNPYNDKKFFYKKGTGQPIHKSKRAFIKGKNIYAS